MRNHELQILVGHWLVNCNLLFSAPGGYSQAFGMYGTVCVCVCACRETPSPLAYFHPPRFYCPALSLIIRRTSTAELPNCCFTQRYVLGFAGIRFRMSDRPRILVLYGSQTGTSKDVAERIFRDARRHHFSSRVSALDDFDVVRFFHSSTKNGS